MNALERLQFVIGLTDKVSTPLDKIEQRFSSLSSRTNSGLMNMGRGMTGMLATGASIYTTLMPGVDVLHAMGEVKSLGVVQGEMDMLEKSAMRFSAHYNESAADFIRSSYDIQSAISGLTNGELAKFTTASGTLAKATKSDTGVITSYVGTMFGIFQEEANKMGKGQWVEMLAGQTATAVQMFKTTGPKMADAFSAVGASATAMGAPMQEQMAILGSLQATMEGGEAGTKYRAFLKGIGNAQKELGLQFTDAQGHMLPMVDILERIKGKFGDIDTVAEGDKLQKAFGSDEAVAMVKLLMKDTSGLAQNIQKLGNANGMQTATQMAEAMLEPFDRMSGSARALHTTFSLMLTRALEPFFNRMASGFDTLNRWAEMFPHLTSLAGKLALVVMGLAAGVSILTVMWGMAQVASVGLGFGALLLSGIWKVLTFQINLNTAALWLLSAGMKTQMAISAAWGAATKFCTALTMGWSGAVRILNLALFANPIGLVILGIVALGAAIAVMIWKWDAITAAFKNTEWGQAVIGWCTDLVGWIGTLGEKWDALTEKFSNFHPLQSIGNFLGVTPAAAGAVDAAGITSSPFPTIAAPVSAGSVTAPVASPVTPVASRIPGGAGKQLAAAITQNNNSGLRIGEMNITTSDPMTPDRIAHLAQFHA